MNRPVRFDIPTLALTTIVLASLACGSNPGATPPSVDTAPPAATSAPTSGSAATPTAKAEQSTPPPAATAGPGEVVVRGDLETTFVPSNLVANQLFEQVTIALFTADQGTGVTLFIPADIQPGDYPIGDLFHLAEADITARFDSFQSGTVSSYESTSGTLVMTETGSSLAGSFTFSAVNTPDGSTSVTVDGNFAGIPLGP